MATRHEKVVIDLDDRFTRPMAGMAASMSLFRRNIDGSDKDLVKFDRTTQDVGRNIDKLSGRLGLLVDVAATLGPALIPTAAAAVPLLAGLSNQLGFAAIAGGTTILAFQGVGDALKALNEQQLNPSAANLEKLHEAMATLGPAGRDFVRELQAMRPELQKLQSAAQAGLFPGMAEGIESLLTRMPQAERIIGEVSSTVGDLLGKAGDSLASHEWDKFFNTLESEARPTLMALGQSIGQITKGLADLWVAFTPLNRDFSTGFLNASTSFAKWADGLSRTQGFADFMAYLHDTGPQVAQTLGALSKALLDVLEAAAPLGGPALMAIKAFSTAVSAIADSHLGTPILAAVAAWRAYSLAVGLAEKAQMRFNVSSAAGGAAGAKGGIFSGYTSSLLGVTSAQERARTAAGKTSATLSAQRGAFLKGAAGAAALGLAVSGVADNMGFANTATLGLAGSMAGPVGAGVGVAVGLFADLNKAGEPLEQTLNRINQAAAAGDWATMAAGLSSVKKQIDDIQHSSGFTDILSDWAKTAGGVLKGNVSFGLGGPQLSHSAVKKQNAAEAVGDSQLRERGAAAANAQMAASSQLAAHGFQLTAAGAREASMSIDQFTFSVRGATAAIEHGNTWDSYRRSLLDAKDAVEKTGKTLNKNGTIIRGQGRDVQRLGLDSRNTLRGLASGALQTAEGMKNVAKRMTFLQGARKSFINLAQGMGLSKAAARALADQLGLVGRIHAKPKIDTNAAQQRAAVRALQNQINAMRGKTVTITVLRNTKGGTAPGGGVANQPGVTRTPADGGQMRARFAGETTGPRDDTIPAMLSHREYVHRVAAVDYYGERFMSDVNSMRLPRPAGYADGGLVGFADGGQARRRHNDNDPTNHVNKFAQALKEATKSLNKEKSARDALISKRSELSGTVRDQFLSDPFAGGNVWAEGGGNPTGILKADIAKANAFKSTLASLKKAGLDGNALASIASTGNIGQAQALLAGGKAGVGAFESAFNQRAAAANAVGAYAGSAAYGAAIARDNAELKTLNATVKRLEKALHHNHADSKKDRKKNAEHTGDRVAAGVNGAVGTAQRHAKGKVG